jgi:hypothetical protein
MQLLMIAVLSLMATPSVQQDPGWLQFSSAEGRFSARMPSDPRISTRVTNTKEGNLLTHMVSSTDDNLNEFMVSWTEYQSADFEKRGTEATFNKIRDALVASNHGKVLSEAIIIAGSRVAKAIKFSTSEGRIITVRFYFVGNRFYQVMAQTKPENTDFAERFFESFKFMPG